MPAIDPPTPRPRTRLDDDAVARLDDLLHAVAEAGNGMPLEAVDGLFSCAILSPEPIAFGELLSLIFGPDHVWESAAQAQEAMDLLQVLWNEIAQRVVRNPENDPRAEGPLLMLPDDYPLSRDAEDDQDGDAPPAPASESDEDADDADVARNLFGGSWAMGFLAGMQLRDAAWERLTRDDRDAAAAVADILSLIPMDAIEEAAQAEAEAAGEAPADDDVEDHELVDDEGAFDDEAPISSETRAQIVEDLPWLLHDLHCARIAAATPREPVRRTDEPGRNELCPCGSGKKYKKCCGDPARLH